MQHYVFSYCPAPRRLLMRLYTTTPNNVLRSNGEKRKWSSMLCMFYVRECSQENIVRITISSRIHFSNSMERGLLFSICWCPALGSGCWCRQTLDYWKTRECHQINCLLQHLAEAFLKASGCMFWMSELSQSILARLTFSISANWSEYQLVERTLDNTTSRRVDNLNALVCSVYLNALFPIRCTSISTLNY